MIVVTARRRESYAMTKSTITRRGRSLAIAAALLCATALSMSSPASAAVTWYLNTDWAPTVMKPGSVDGGFKAELGNKGDTGGPGPVTVVWELPTGMAFNGTSAPAPGVGGPACAGTTTVTCTTLPFLGPTSPYRYLQLSNFEIGVDVDPLMAPGIYPVSTTVSGGGADPVTKVDQIQVGDEDTNFGVIPGTFKAGAFDEAGADYTQAGGHPYEGTTSFDLNANQLVLAGNEGPRTAGGLKDVVVDLPPGFVGNPEALPKCDNVGMLKNRLCPPETQVGVSYIEALGAAKTQGTGIYNMVPEEGAPAQFGFFTPGDVAVLLTPVLQTDGNYAISVKAMNLNETAPIRGVTRVTLWGVPADASHDDERCAVPNVLPQACVGVDSLGTLPSGPTFPPDSYSPHSSTAPPLAFLTNPTQCTGQPVETHQHLSNWNDPGEYGDNDLPDLSDTSWNSVTALAPAVTGCENVPFDPTFGVSTDNAQADGPAGLTVDLGFPQDGLTDPDALATAHLDKTVVTLPDGLTVNPSGAAGLQGCTDEQMGVVEQGNPPRFNPDDPFNNKGGECPEGSKIGTAEVTSPILSEKLTGDVVLGVPESTDPQSGKMFRLFLVLRNEERGLLVKVFGSSVADPNTGRLTATFDENPQLPLDDLQVKLKGGERSMLAMPQRCGSPSWTAELTPWTASAGGPIRNLSGGLTVGGDCSFGFAPWLRSAGMSSSTARGGGEFSATFVRNEGQQSIRSITAELPTGLLASVKDVPLCANAQADAGACPAASRIGTVDAAAGSGAPFFLERKGDAYLTEGYKGAPYGMMVKVPVEAGPFRGQLALTPIVVRQALQVDSTDASVTAVSDPLPQIWHGIPLRVREITVKVDRPRFMLNPSSCSGKGITATMVSTEGASAASTRYFQASDCGRLSFKPRLKLRLTGKRQRSTGRHPGVRARVNQAGIGEAGIRRAVVRLPRSLALDPDNAQALCEFEAGTKPDLENHCPKGSIVGRARAKTPLLERDLVGNVYFVKNVRKDAKTGNEIRTLPMIIVALRGEIAVNLRGVSSTTKNGRLVNTFAKVPDAPISRFNLNIAGGRNGILAVTRTRAKRINLCNGRHVAEADFDGQNGKRFDRDIRVRTPCKGFKKKRAAAKRKAAAKRRAAAKKRRG
jgi:hypothetical protein